MRTQYWMSRGSRSVLCFVSCALAFGGVSAQHKPVITEPRAAPVALRAVAPTVAPLAVSAALLDPSTARPDASRLVTLPKLSEREIREFASDLLAELELTRGYVKVAPETLKLHVPSERITIVAAAARKSGDRTEILRFGYVIQPRRLPQLWIHGASIGPVDVKANPDAQVETLDPLMKALLNDRVKVRSSLALSELQPRTISLSYIDADGALFALRAMGFSAITDDDALPVDDAYRGNDVALMSGGSGRDGDPVKPSTSKPTGGAATPAPAGGLTIAPLGGGFNLSSGNDSPGGSDSPGSIGSVSGLSSDGDSKPKPRKFPATKNLPTSINYDRLPLIVKMPSPDGQNVGLVGGGDATGAGAPRENSLGLTVIPGTATSLGSTISAGTSQLLVLTHPDAPEQFAKVRRAIEDVIDKPARQVFVEGLVLEISQQGIEELGVQWQSKNGTTSLQLGTVIQLAPGSGQSALSVVKDSLLPFDPRQFLARVNALVDRNKAEILSRPSILTLDDRQATIRVGTDIPIATSKDTSSGSGGGRVAFSFQYLPTGILLNVRPRISEDAREISMLIDATVSATVPGQDLRLVDPTNGFLLASAPTISTRRVQTYARIVNNTPLIIGGLVSRDQTRQEDKVPGLGDIPILGKLFGFESKKDARREVIIVLTPSVLTEEFRATKPQLPKDDDRFDLTGTTLFRESYRIRAEDLIDSQFIRFNQRLITYRNIVNQVVRVNPELANVQPYAQFRGSRVPGEFIFVSGMMSRMLSRLNAGAAVNLDKLVFFEGVKGEAFKTASVGDLLRRFGDGKTSSGFFAKNPGKALTMRFRYARSSDKPGDWATEPMAEIGLVACADRDAWRKLLWDLNQPVNGVQEYYTIVIHDESDLERLKLAMALKNTILANGNVAGTIFDNFLPGRMLAMQEIAPEWERTLEASIGRYFFYGELFYPAFSAEHERAIGVLDQALRQPQMAPYVTGIRLP